MATVEFKCPKCGQICAFIDRHVGRRARCTKCSTYFLIPPAGQPARALKPALSDHGPCSGFWSALLKETPKAMRHPDSLPPLTIMVFQSILRFYIGHPFFVIMIPFFLFMLPLPIGVFVSILTFLSQSRYLFNLIQSTADQNDPFPRFLDGTYVDRLFDGIVSAYSFLSLAGLWMSPAMAIYAAFKKMQLASQWPIIAAAAAGLFFLPLSITIYAYSRDMILSLRMDHIMRAIRKAFWPHFLLYVMNLAIAALFWQSSLYNYKTPPETFVSNLLMHSFAASLIVLAARTAGLFYRHYGCYLP